MIRVTEKGPLRGLSMLGAAPCEINPARVTVWRLARGRAECPVALSSLYTWWRGQLRWP